MKRLVFLSAALISLTRVIAQTVFVDPAFNPEDRGFNHGGAFNAGVAQVIVLPDGKLLACGSFTEYNGTPCSRVVRLLPDGEIDPTFDVGSGPDGGVGFMIIQPDGKILLAGGFFHFNGSSRWHMARIHSDGTFDETFDQGTDPGTVFYGQVESFALQPDGKVLLGGYHFCGDGVVQNCLKRFNPDGSLDTSFNTGGAGICVNNEYVGSIHVRPDNKILIAGTFAHYNGQTVSNMVLLNGDGTVDNSFPAAIFNGSTRLVDFFPDGDMLITGNFTTVNGVEHPGISKLSPDGVLDPGFHPEFEYLGSVSYAICATILADGRSLVGGRFDACNGIERNGIARLMPDGSLDATFTTEERMYGTITNITELNDGRLILTGANTGYELSYMFGINRALPDGALDRSWNPGSGVNGDVRSLALQPDGKLIITGKFSRVNSTWTPGIARINTDGSLDPSFNVGEGLFSEALDIKVRADGRILLSGVALYDAQPTSDVIQLEADGTMDPSFDPQCGPYSGIYDMALLSDGSTLVCGNFHTIDGISRRAVARLDENGNVDPGFDPGVGSPSSLIRSLSVGNDGRIVLGGWFDDWNGLPAGNIVRLLPNGAADPTFSTGAGFDDAVHSVLVQPDGRILACGAFSSYYGIARQGIARLNADGSLDTTFDPGTGLDGRWSTLLLEPDGKLIVAGTFTSVNGQPMSNIVRLTTTGQVDPEFTVGSGFTRNGYGTIPAVNDMTLLPNGQLLVGGAFTAFNGVGRNRVVRLFAPTSVGMSEPQSTATAAVWPNPCNGTLVNASVTNIVPGERVLLTVVDASGRTVWQRSTNGAGPWELQFDGSLASGTYQLVVLANGGMARTTLVAQP